MENDNIFDRIAQLIELESKGVVAQFAKKVGIEDQSLRNVVNRRKSYPGYEILRKIIQSIDGLNADWLMTGRGEMKKVTINREIMFSGPETKYTRNDDLFEIVKSQQRTIESQQEVISVFIIKEKNHTAGGV